MVADNVGMTECGSAWTLPHALIDSCNFKAPCFDLASDRNSSETRPTFTGYRKLDAALMRRNVILTRTLYPANVALHHVLGIPLLHKTDQCSEKFCSLKRLLVACCLLWFNLLSVDYSLAV